MVTDGIGEINGNKCKQIGALFFPNGIKTLCPCGLNPRSFQEIC